MTQLTVSYDTARMRAKSLLLSLKGDWSQVLPSPEDESWRRVNISMIPWNQLTDLLTSFQLQDLNCQIEGSHSIPSSEEKDRLLDYLAEYSELEDRLIQPDEPKTEPAAFFRRDIFTLINLAFSKPVALVARPEDRLTIRHLPSHNLFLPSTVLFVPSGIEATVVEEFPDDASFLRSGHSVIIVEEGARLRYVQIRHDGDSAHFHHVRFLVKRDAIVEAGLLQCGGNTGKTFYQASIVGRGGEFHGKALFSGHEGQVFHLEMGVQHLADYSVSSLLYKTVMDDHSHSVFLGNLEIPAGVKKVQSHQLNHNLILAKRARAESRPWLVIRAEDVACEHGATAGDLDEEILFFLQSRGLPREEARRLMIEGFFEEVLGQMPLTENEKQDFRLRSF